MLFPYGKQHGVKKKSLGEDAGENSRVVLNHHTPQGIQIPVRGSGDGSRHRAAKGVDGSLSSAREGTGRGLPLCIGQPGIGQQKKWTREHSSESGEPVASGAICRRSRGCDVSQGGCVPRSRSQVPGATVLNRQVGRRVVIVDHDAVAFLVWGVGG